MQRLTYWYIILQTSQVAQCWRIHLLMQETRVWFLSQGDPLEGEMAITPVFLPGEFHRQRSLMARVHEVAKTQTWLRDQSCILLFCCFSLLSLYYTHAHLLYYFYQKKIGLSKFLWLFTCLTMKICPCNKIVLLYSEGLHHQALTNQSIGPLFLDL